MANRLDDESVQQTIAFVDRIFGEGTGERHVKFLNRLENDALREAIHRFHRIEGDTTWLSLEENYLLGVCVLCATKNYETAALFAKTLRHLGCPKEKILEAVGRLSMWIGGLPAADASFVIQRALREYEQKGVESLAVWFPKSAPIKADKPATAAPVAKNGGDR